MVCPLVHISSTYTPLNGHRFEELRTHLSSHVQDLQWSPQYEGIWRETWSCIASIPYCRRSGFLIQPAACSSSSSSSCWSRGSSFLAHSLRDSQQWATGHQLQRLNNTLGMLSLLLLVPVRGFSLRDKCESKICKTMLLKRLFISFYRHALNDLDRVFGCAYYVMAFLPPGALVIFGEGTIDIRWHDDHHGTWSSSITELNGSDKSFLDTFAILYPMPYSSNTSMPKILLSGKNTPLPAHLKLSAKGKRWLTPVNFWWCPFMSEKQKTSTAAMR